MSDQNKTTGRNSAEIAAWLEGYDACTRTLLAMRDATPDATLRATIQTLAGHLENARPINALRRAVRQT